MSVISDLWKALDPIFFVGLFLAKQQWVATAASAIWAACLLYSVTSAVGAAIEDRSSRASNRETIVMNYDELTADVKRLEEKRNGLRAHRPAPIVEVAINALFMRPVESHRHTPSIVGELSANCRHADQRTTDVCAEVAQLQEELAAAKDENDLDREIEKLKGQARDSESAARSSCPIRKRNCWPVSRAGGFQHATSVGHSPFCWPSLLSSSLRLARPSSQATPKRR